MGDMACAYVGSGGEAKTCASGSRHGTGWGTGRGDGSIGCRGGGQAEHADGGGSFVGCGLSDGCGRGDGWGQGDWRGGK